MLQGDTPFLLKNKPLIKADKGWSKSAEQAGEGRRRERKRRGKDSSDRDKPRKDRGERVNKKNMPVDEGMLRYRIEVGHDHKVKPGNIVGAIANEAGLESKYIGRINIYDNHSLIDLPEGMPKDIFDSVKKLWVAGQQLRISRALKEDEYKKSKQQNSKHDKDKKRSKNDKKPRRTVKKK